MLANSKELSGGQRWCSAWCRGEESQKESRSRPAQPVSPGQFSVEPSLTYSVKPSGRYTLWPIHQVIIRGWVFVLCGGSLGGYCEPRLMWKECISFCVLDGWQTSRRKSRFSRAWLRVSAFMVEIIRVMILTCCQNGKKWELGLGLGLVNLSILVVSILLRD